MKTIKASTDKPNGNTTPRDKTLVLEPYIYFFEIEDGDKTK